MNYDVVKREAFRNMKKSTDAYLDIETTGLSPSQHEITMIGIHVVNGTSSKLVQLVGDDVTEQNLLDALEGVETIYTYNGSRFDLPFIRARLGTDLTTIYHHHDLMYDCWKNDLYGGLKSVEVKLGISRKVKGVGGFEAVQLWWRYKNDYDHKALAKLMKYNKEDVVNLQVLREKL